MSLLWPHYLRTIPSLSIVELLPDIDVLKMSERINARFGVLSQPVGPKKRYVSIVLPSPSRSIRCLSRR